jgi:hypothetical protein
MELPWHRSVSFVDLLTEIEDPRRAEGKLYRLPHVVLFAILAIVAGANSYRTIHSFINVRIARLREAFGVKWGKAPAYRFNTAAWRGIRASIAQDTWSRARCIGRAEPELCPALLPAKESHGTASRNPLRRYPTAVCISMLHFDSPSPRRER